MKIVVMSDTHMSRVTGEFEEICSRYCTDADLVIHLGDWTSNSVLSFLEQYPLEAVSGNMDDYTVRDLLPPKKVIAVKGLRFGLAHGWGSPVGLRRRLINEFEGVHAILFGHTHEPLRVEENSIFWFNPGSVTMGRGGHYTGSLGILHVDETIESEIVAL